MKNLGRMISPILGDDAIHNSTTGIHPMRAIIHACEVSHMGQLYWNRYQAVPHVKWYHPLAIWYRIKESYYRKKFCKCEEVYDKLCQIINDAEVDSV